MTGWDLILNRDVGDQGASALLLTSHQGVSGLRHLKREGRVFQQTLSASLKNTHQIIAKAASSSDVKQGHATFSWLWLKQSMRLRRMNRFTAFLTLGISLLVFILVIKVSVIRSISPLIYEVGEVELGHGYQACRHEFSIETSGHTYQSLPLGACDNYWFKARYRGFFMHHYGSFDFPQIESSSSIAQGITHQYGVAGRALVIALRYLGISADPSHFAILSILSILPFSAVVLSLLARLHASRIASCIYIYLICLYLASLDMTQLILSPGFGPLRHLPACILLAILASWPQSRDIRVPLMLANPKPRIFALFMLTFALSAINSASSNLMIAASVAIPLFTASLSVMAFNGKTLTLPLASKTDILDLLAFVSGIAFILILQIYLILKLDPSSLLGSASGGHMAVKPWIAFSAYYVLAHYMFARIPSDLSSKTPFEKVFRIALPLGIAPLFLVLYSVNYWGSPNHLASGWLLISVPISLLLSNSLRSLHCIDGTVRLNASGDNSLINEKELGPFQSLWTSFAAQVQLTRAKLTAFRRSGILVCSIALCWSFPGWYALNAGRKAFSDLKSVRQARFVKSPQSCELITVNFGAIHFSSCNGARRKELESMLNIVKNDYKHSSNERPRLTSPGLLSPIISDSANLLGSAYFPHTTIGFEPPQTGAERAPGKEQMLLVLNRFFRSTNNCIAYRRSIHPNVIRENTTSYYETLMSCMDGLINPLMKELVASSIRLDTMPPVGGHQLREAPYIIFANSQFVRSAFLASAASLFGVWNQAGQDLLQPNGRAGYETAKKLHLYSFRERLREAIASQKNYRVLPTNSQHFVAYKKLVDR